jgi:hypothetical protein
MPKVIAVIACLFYCCQVYPQHFTLDQLLKLYLMPIDAAAKELKQQGWSTRHVTDGANVRTFILQYNDTPNEDTFYIQLQEFFQRKSFGYFFVSQTIYDTIFSTALTQGNKSIVFTNRKGRMENGLLSKDSSTVINLVKNVDSANGTQSFEIYVEDFRSWLTAKMPDNATKRWTKADRYRFMVKCVGSQEPALLDDVASACACGGSILEMKENIRSILTLTRDQLLERVKGCFRLVGIEPH